MSRGYLTSVDMERKGIRRSYIGSSVLSTQQYEKITGKAVFVSDMNYQTALHVTIKRSTVPHAKILRVDVSKCKQLPGVVAVVTADDVPSGLHGRGLMDTPIFAKKVVRYVGEPVAAVAAIDYDTAIEALDLIEVEYESVEPLFDLEESLKENPRAVIHPDLGNYKRLSSKLYRVQTIPSKPNVSAYQKIVTGDVERAFKEADFIVKGVYTTTPVSHAQLEPTSIIAKMEPDGRVNVITSGQTPFRTRKELSDSLMIPEQKIRVIVPQHVGGGFGNRGAAIYEPICAALAMHTNGRPVKLTLTRMEEMATTTSRHGTKILIEDAVKRDGLIIGRKMTVIYNGGAYSVAGNVAVRNAVYAISSVYKVPNIKAEIYRVYTNQIQGGAFRGFGTTQLYWAIESQIDEIAHTLNIDPIELRMKNILKHNDRSCIGEIMKDDTMDYCLEEFAKMVTQRPLSKAHDPAWKVGRGIAIAKHQCDVTYPNVAIVKLVEDGYVDLMMSSTDVGQGIFTGLSQIAAEELGFPIEKIRIIHSDTAITPVATGSSGSRQLVQMGLAVAAACREVKNKIIKYASKVLQRPEDELTIIDGNIWDKTLERQLVSVKDLFSPGPMGGDYLAEEGIILGKGVFYSDISEIDPETGQIYGGTQAALDYTPICACADVAIDPETGELKVLYLLIVTDVGKAINPSAIEGQIHGGALMGISTALYEQLVIENGQVVNPTFMDYMIASSVDTPPRIEYKILESGKGPGYRGARSIGEIPILPIAPAIGNAVRNALGLRITSLPLTQEKIFNLMKGERSNFKLST